MVVLRCSSGFHLHHLSLLLATEGVVRNGKSTAGHQRYLGQFGYRELLYYKGFPGMSTPGLRFLSAL